MGPHTRAWGARERTWALAVFEIGAAMKLIVTFVLGGLGGALIAASGLVLLLAPWLLFRRRLTPPSVPRARATGRAA